MNELLRPGQSIRTDSGTACHVEQFLGGGGQGEVYKASWGGKPYALKWYFPQVATQAQLTNLQTLVNKRAPDHRFLWPLELLSQSGQPGYGYLMHLREPRYTGILDLLKRRVEPTFKALTSAGRQLADCYLELHGKGLCYCDISFGNLFWDAQTGDVLICDNDNVVVNGSRPEIGGTIGFMAPEVVTGKSLPGIETDKFSLAVLLFYMFMLHHPLEGKRETAIKCLDQPAKVKLYGAEPIFIFDPKNNANRPDDRYHSVVNNFWRIYPPFFQGLFIKAFTDGISDPKNGRVTESQWAAAMIKLGDSIMYCSHCAAENFYDEDALKASAGKPSSCWSCGVDIVLPFRLRIARNVVMLNHDTKLYPYHLDDSRRDFSRPVAEVVKHPTDPKVWGLKNLSRNKWVISAADGLLKDVEHGRSATLASGMKINFGNVDGEVTY